MTSVASNGYWMLIIVFYFHFYALIIVHMKSQRRNIFVCEVFMSRQLMHNIPIYDP